MGAVGGEASELTDFSRLGPQPTRQGAREAPSEGQPGAPLRYPVEAATGGQTLVLLRRRYIS